MLDNTPDYEKYDLEDLIDTLKRVDRVNYPERAKLIESELKRRKRPLKPDAQQQSRKALNFFAIGAFEALIWLAILLLPLAGFSLL